MKLLCLNTWGCRVDTIFDYIQKNSDAEIICLQEVIEGGEKETERHEKTNSFEMISKLLPHHSGYFAKYIHGSHYGEEPKNFSFGISTFVKTSIKHSLYKNIELLDADKKWNDYSGRFAGGVAQAVTVGDFTIINVHGLWQDLVIEDTEAKIEESHTILRLANETA